MAKKKKGNKTSKKQESNIVTKESFCATGILFSFLALLILVSKSSIFGNIGAAIHSCLMGLFGYFSYPIFLGVFYLSGAGLIGKKFIKNKKFVTCATLFLISLGFVVQMAMTYSWSLEGYVKKCFQSGKNFPNTAVLGVVGGFLIYQLVGFMTKLGTITMFSVLTVLFGYLVYLTAKKREAKQEEQSKKEKKKEAKQKKAGKKKEEPEESAKPIDSKKPAVVLGDAAAAPPNATRPQDERPEREFLFGASPAENYKRNLIFDPNARVNHRTIDREVPSMPERESVYVPSYSESYEGSMNTQQPTPPVIDTRDVERDRGTYTYNQPRQPEVSPQPFYQPEKSYVEDSYEEVAPSVYDNRRDGEEYETPSYETRDTRGETSTEPQNSIENKEEPYQRHKYMGLFSPDNPNIFGDREDSSRVREGIGSDYSERNSYLSYKEEDYNDSSKGRDGSRLLDDDEDDPYTLRSDYEEESRYGRNVAEERGRGSEISRPSSVDIGMETRGRGLEEPSKPVEQPKPVEPPKPRVIKPYKRVPLDDFDCRDIEPSFNQQEVEYTKENILAILEEFKITGATIASVTFGPTVTCYNLILPRNIPPRKVIALEEPIGVGIHTEGISIYTNYGEGGVTIEIPNKVRQFVQLGCMLSGDTFVNAKSSSLMFAMGKDVANRKVYGDVTKMIHMLVAGSSGSGKSVFLGSLIISLIYKYPPEELRLILIDPKKTEFVLYNNLPHLMINEIITDAGKAVQSLNWAIGEMNRRYGLFEQMSRAGTYVVNLDQYNEQMEKSQRLPKIVIIIDELADLMLAAKKEMEDRIQNLTQKARAAGIHLIVATQRPSTDVITGVIKSNLATRIAFGVATDVDSRVILDQSGAQKLLGKGDFLYTMPGLNLPVRVQSAFISPEDSQKVVNFIKNNNEAYYDEEATAYINSRGGNGGSPSDPFASGNSGDNVDPVYIEALRYVILSNSASISMIQRKCSAGYNRAGKIIEWMQDMGYISPFDGAKARKVLITKEEFESKYGPLDK